MKSVSVFGVSLLLGAGLASAASLEDEGYPALFVTPPAVEAAPDATAAGETAAVEAAPVAVAADPAAVEAATTEPAAEVFPATFYDPEVQAPPAGPEAQEDTAADTSALPEESVGAPPASAEEAVEQAAPVPVDPAVAEAAAMRREELRELRGPYVGIGGGSDHVALAGISDGSGAGLLVGYRITEMFAAEFALNAADYTTPVANCLLDNLTTGLYGVARTGGEHGANRGESVYLKGRLGVLSESLSSVGNCAGAPVDDVLASVGVGVGVRLGSAAIEFEYTLIEEDIYRLGWSLQLNF